MRGIALAILVAGFAIERAVCKADIEYMELITLLACLVCIAAGW
jgi:hypothetical protein